LKSGESETIAPAVPSPEKLTVKLWMAAAKSAPKEKLKEAA
jgi:hypothetical protein